MRSREDESLNRVSDRGGGYGRIVLKYAALQKEASLQGQLVQSFVTLHCVGE